MTAPPTPSICLSQIRYGAPSGPMICFGLSATTYYYH